MSPIGAAPWSSRSSSTRGRQDGWGAADAAPPYKRRRFGTPPRQPPQHDRQDRQDRRDYHNRPQQPSAPPPPRNARGVFTPGQGREPLPDGEGSSGNSHRRWGSAPHRKWQQNDHQKGGRGHKDDWRGSSWNGWGDKGGKDKGGKKGGGKGWDNWRRTPAQSALERELWNVTRVDLIARAKAARKSGADPLMGKGCDPARYDDNDLRGYLLEAEPYVASLGGLPPPEKEKEEAPVETSELKEQLVAQVKACNSEEWHAFCQKTWGKFDPCLYPCDVLQRFLDGLEPPNIEELGSGDLYEMSKGDLIIRCKMAVKQGAPALIGQGRDPARYSEEELIEYLLSLGPDGVVKEEGEEGEVRGDAGDAGDQVNEFIDGIAEEEMYPPMNEVKEEGADHPEEPEQDGDQEASTPIGGSGGGGAYVQQLYTFKKKR